MHSRNTKKLVLLIVCIIMTAVLVCSATLGWFVRRDRAGVGFGMKVLNYNMLITHGGVELPVDPSTGKFRVSVEDFDNSVPSGYPYGLAPGTQGEFEFTIHNTGNVPVNYFVDFSNQDVFPVNLDWTIKKSGETYAALDSLTGSVEGEESVTYYIKYEWPINDNPTGNQTDTEYILDSDNNGKIKELEMNVRFEQKI